MIKDGKGFLWITLAPKNLRLRKDAPHAQHVVQASTAQEFHDQVQVLWKPRLKWGVPARHGGT